MAGPAAARSSLPQPRHRAVAGWLTVHDGHSAFGDHWAVSDRRASSNHWALSAGRKRGRWGVRDAIQYGQSLDWHGVGGRPGLGGLCRRAAVWMGERRDEYHDLGHTLVKGGNFSWVR